MDSLAEKLSEWFGSTPFILMHIVWFVLWYPVTMGLLGWSFEQATVILTLIVSLEAIFLSLFILRAENIQGERMEAYIKETRTASKKDLAATKRIERKIKPKAR